MAVVTVPVPSDDDILGWTRESLEGSPVAARLRPLFEALNLQHLDRNDAARGDCPCIRIPAIFEVMIQWQPNSQFTSLLPKG